MATGQHVKETPNQTEHTARNKEITKHSANQTQNKVQKNLITVLNRETIYSVKKSETVKMSQHSPQHIQHNIQKITTALTHSLASFTNKTTDSKKTSLNS